MMFLLDQLIMEHLVVALRSSDGLKHNLEKEKGSSCI
jgi:hypothetical protein